MQDKSADGGIWQLVAWCGVVGLGWAACTAMPPTRGAHLSHDAPTRGALINNNAPSKGRGVPSQYQSPQQGGPPQGGATSVAFTPSFGRGLSVRHSPQQRGAHLSKEAPGKGGPYQHQCPQQGGGIPTPLPPARPPPVRNDALKKRGHYQQHRK